MLCLCVYLSDMCPCCHAGLGTSSILGGAIMAALWRATGQNHSRDSLIHAVSTVQPESFTGENLCESTKTLTFP